MKYVNTRTGVVIDTECKITGPEWVAEKPEAEKAEPEKKKGSKKK